MVLGELKQYAPMLLSILSSCTTTRSPRDNRDAVIGFVSSILLKFQFGKMNTVQKLVSLILYAGHFGKQVCQV